MEKWKRRSLAFDSWRGSLYLAKIFNQKPRSSPESADWTLSESFIIRPDSDIYPETPEKEVPKSSVRQRPASINGPLLGSRSELVLN